MFRFLPSLKPSAFNSAKKTWCWAAVERELRLGPSIPTRQILPACCARAASGQPAAVPPTSVMNSRRLTGRPFKQRVLPYHAVGCIMHHSKFRWLMSALGQKRTSRQVWSMSALPPKADIETQPLNVRFVPKADIMHRSKNPLFD